MDNSLTLLAKGAIAPLADSKEAAFQQDIINALAAQGWLVGTAAGYNPTTALYTEDLLAYVQTAWGDRWQKLCKSPPSDPASVLIQKTVRALEKTGTLDVLRHGYKLPGVKVELCSFKPDHAMNPDIQARYQANRLRIVPEVSYSPHARKGPDSTNNYNPRLDLVLFVNGIPTATLELKSDFKQPIENAKRQYCHDRPTKAPFTRKAELLLTFKRGALVHFAVSQQDVAMTTKLAGKDTFFLPYYTKAELADVSDPQIIYDLQGKLDAIYHWQEVEAFALAFFNPKAANAKLKYYCQPAVHRFKQCYNLAKTNRRQALEQKRAAQGNSNRLKQADHELKAAGEQIDQLDLFKKNLQSFVRLYEFLSQIVDYEDPELEQLCVYAKHLHPLLRRDRPAHQPPGRRDGPGQQPHPRPGDARPVSQTGGRYGARRHDRPRKAVPGSAG